MRIHNGIVYGEFRRYRYAIMMTEPRRLAGAVAIFLLALITPLQARDAPDLREFAARAGLQDTSGFADTMTVLRSNGRLPARYLTKHAAEALGWKPGQDLCRAAPGRAIGGDNFSNRERRLPDKRDRRWHEADLDYACGARGPKRLVWSSDGLAFVTVDHYTSFVPVP
jgi:hypothetical protein